MKVISIVGYKKSGKTMLVERLGAALRARGKVGTVKHVHHGIELNPPGTDTRRHMDAGAEVAIAVAPEMSAMYVRWNSLQQALDGLADAGMDFAVVEGFKDSELPKVVIGDLDVKNEVARIRDAEAEIEELVRITMLQPDYYTLPALIRKVRSMKTIRQAGAIGTFTGIVRERTGNTVTKSLEFEKYDEVAEEKMKLICDELSRRDGIAGVLIHHRTGVIAPGDDIVYIVVAASHRQQLFPVLSEAIERLKEEVPIWKKEHTNEGQYWVHEEQ
ncbi:MAG TPA: molybdopterin synthase [Candidatus Methanoperedenaceae archaeon]|nr:molybdopterin synthase [Candidatus Methanoperedenaceae archaeon]